MKKEYKAPSWKRGSIRESEISPMEWIEYRQTGMIKVKDTPISRGELQRLKSHKSIGYYDFAYRQKCLIDILDLL